MSGDHPDATWVRCQTCQAAFYPAQRHCTACGTWDDFRAEPLPRSGVLFAWTVIHVGTATPPLPPPYALGYADLDGGPRVLAPIAVAGDAETALASGQRLALVVHAAGDPVPFHLEPA